MKLGCVDIGSNSVRLLIVKVSERKGKVVFNKLQLFRLPVRLGVDVFEYGNISEEKINALIKTIEAYKNIFSVYGVEKYVINATSAMRDAVNRNEVISEVKENTGETVTIISGEKEAQLIGLNIKQIVEQIELNKPYCYLDIGGGSTEICLFRGEKLVENRSFNLGTIRMLKKKDSENESDMFISWLRNYKHLITDAFVFASGGNVNRVFKIIGNSSKKTIDTIKISALFDIMNSLSVQERMKLYQLKKDRAEVIIPAMKILKIFHKEIQNKTFFVPQLGLADGSIHELYLSIKKNEYD